MAAPRMRSGAAAATRLTMALARHRTDLLIGLLLLVAPLLLFAPVVLGSRTLLPADNLWSIEPWRSAAPELGAGPNPIPHNRLLDDLILENYPWKRFILESLRAGELPLWNPHQFAGIPFLAAGQHSALYPFSIIYYVIPLPRAYGIFTVVQLFLAGLWMYLFLRVLRLSQAPAALGAVVYELSLFMVASAVFPMIVAAAAWLPLVLATIEVIVRGAANAGGQPIADRAVEPGGPTTFDDRPPTEDRAAEPSLTPTPAQPHTHTLALILGAGAIGMQILAGHVEITYYSLLVAAAYSVWRLAAELVRGWRASGLARRVAGRAATLLALVGLGVALGAVQFVPLLELVQHNFRSGAATFEQIIGWAFPWKRAIAFLIPNFFGNPSHHGYFDLFSWRWVPATVNALGDPVTTIDWGPAVKNFVEGAAYAGILPLVLAAIAVANWAIGFWRGRRRPQAARQPRPDEGVVFSAHLPFFLLLALASLAFIFPTRLYALIFWLPGVNQLHSPFRWVWPLTLAVAALAAFGLQSLLDQRRGGDGDGQARMPFSAVLLAGRLALAAGLGLAAGLVLARLGYDALGIGRLVERAFAQMDLARRTFADARMFFSYEARWVMVLAAMLIATGLVLLASRRARPGRSHAAWQLAAIGVVVVDLVIAGWGFNSAADPRSLRYIPPSVAFLRQDIELWRFTTYDPNGDKPFNANSGWHFDLQDIRGYDSIFTGQYRRYMELIQPQAELEFNRIAPLTAPEALDSPLLDLLNVRYVISVVPIDNPRYNLVYDGEVRIYRNATALPRAFTLPLSATLVTLDFGAAVQEFDPRHYVISEDPALANLATAPQPAEPAPAADVDYGANEVIVTAGVDEPAWLVLADSYFPGWKAYVRPAGAALDQEQSAAIHLVNGNFRGVQLAPGAWTVRFKYSPDSFKLGGIVSFTAGMTLLFVLGLAAWRFFYRESAVNSTARRVAKNSLAPMALNLANRVIDLAFAAFMLRVLGPGDAGKYYFAIVIFGWFEIVTNYGLDTLLTRDVARDPRHANRYLVNTTILRLLLGLAAIPALAFILAVFQLVPGGRLPFGLGVFDPVRLTSDTLLAIGLLVLAQAPATVAASLTGLFRAFEKAEYPAAVATVATLVKVSLGTVALVMGLRIVGLAATSLAVNLVTLAILATLAARLFFSDRPFRLEWDWPFQRHAVREAFPLMLNNLLATLFFKVDVTLLQPIRGPAEVGWYSTGYKFVDAYNVVPSLFTFALFPVMARQARDDRAALRRSYRLAIKLLVGVSLPLAVITMRLAPVLVGLLGGADYLPHGATALALLVWSIPFGWINSITNYVLIALDQQRGLTRAFAVALAFNVALNLLLLPRYGFAAAAAITIASEILEGVAFYVYLRRSLGPIAWLSLLWRLWLSAGAMVGILYGLWAVQPLLALAAGAVAYLLGVVVLRAFTPEEQSTLRAILPARFRPAAPDAQPPAAEPQTPAAGGGQ